MLLFVINSMHVSNMHRTDPNIAAYLAANTKKTVNPGCTRLMYCLPAKRFALVSPQNVAIEACFSFLVKICSLP